MEWTRGEHTISTDAARLDLDLVHRFLSREAYWAKGRSRDLVERSVRASLCFGVYTARGAQVGFARVVTDYATFAWVCDVFVLGEARGAGIGTWLMEVLVAHPDLRGLRRIMLGTRDAHGLYRKVGFEALAAPARFMEIFRGP